jgi:hypothetical protein
LARKKKVTLKAAYRLSTVEKDPLSNGEELVSLKSKGIMVICI